jgi:hypothetical protein
MTFQDVAQVVGVLLPGGIPPVIKAFADYRRKEQQKQKQPTGDGQAQPARAPADNAWLAPIGLIFSIFALAFAGIAVYYGLSSALSDGGPMMSARIGAALLGSFALSASLIGFLSVKDRYFDVQWTTGIAGMLMGVGTLFAMLVIG